MKDDLENLRESIYSHYIQVQKDHTPSLVALNFHSGHSNTTHTKSYKKHAHTIQCGPLNKIIEIDAEQKWVIVEPRVTMQKLVETLKPYKLMIPVIPEFKGITVGGALLGAAAESSSYRYGIFHDQCESVEVISGNGSLITATPVENEDLFWGISGSYGSLGPLGKIKLKLSQIKNWVHLKYSFFKNLKEAMDFLIEQIGKQVADFLDGVVFSRESIVIIQGFLCSSQNSPIFSQKKRGAAWYFQHVRELQKKGAVCEERMELEEYLFRYDLAAFWMGAYLYDYAFLKRFVYEGILKWSTKEGFNAQEVARFCQVKNPNYCMRAIGRCALNSQNLWRLLHKAEKWIRNRFLIQDFCIPSQKATAFLNEIMQNPAIYPLWLCPIKGTTQPQIFAPHLIAHSSDPYFINIGVYGMPIHAGSLKVMTHQLEHKTRKYDGKKVLYSYNYYTEEEFWHIYSRNSYESLRQMTHAEGFWHEITQKVLCE